MPRDRLLLSISVGIQIAIGRQLAVCKITANTSSPSRLKSSIFSNPDCLILIVNLPMVGLGKILISDGSSSGFKSRDKHSVFITNPLPTLTVKEFITMLVFDSEREQLR